MTQPAKPTGIMLNYHHSPVITALEVEWLAIVANCSANGCEDCQVLIPCRDAWDVHVADPSFMVGRKSAAAREAALAQARRFATSGH